MAEFGRLSDRELEAAIRDLGAHYPNPPTPDLARQVTARLVNAPTPADRRRVEGAPNLRRLALAAVILIALVGVAALANPASRDAIAHFFHVRGVVVTKSSALPSVSASPLNLGPSVTLGQAQAQISFVIVVPSELGSPDAVYVDPSVPGGEVMLAYKPRPGIPLVSQTGLGLLITEFRGDVNPELLLKSVGGETTVEETTTASGDPAWWIAGRPHLIIVQVTPGSNRTETLRLAANTLIWQDEEVTLRIESGLTKSGAMEVASHMP